MARFERQLIWIPAPVDVVRKYVRKAGVGQAALVAVESGTVLMPTRQAGIGQLNVLLAAGRKAGGAAVVFRWNNSFSYPELVFTRIRLPGQDRRIAALAQAFQVDVEVVRPHAHDGQVDGGVGNVVRLLEAVGRQDVVPVAELADAGTFDVHDDPLLVRYQKICTALGFVLYFALAAFFFMVIERLLGTPGWVGPVVIAVSAHLTIYLLPRYLMAFVEVDRMLPIARLPVVVQPEASESQSAKYEANEPRTNNL
jgi:hypothetical protein